MEPKNLTESRPNEVVRQNTKIRNIELDDIPEINNLAQELSSLPMEEKVRRVSDFIKSKLKNAMPVDKASLPESEQEKIRKVFDQKTSKKLSECIENGYGVCLDYNALGKSIFDKLGIPAEFKVGQIDGGPKHTYLDIEINGSWQIFDPFAEVFMLERGSTNKLFHSDYYSDSITNNKKVI